ncbi:hypothetical protein Bca4012_030849 [Brassica carinata]|uniref:Telomere repeat-binding protein 1-6-like ubiquitin-like domain-containing protein n=3 Tax=Brassica TaxID=3705 RepID=A0A0D3BVW9_BRAOL|nr:unnamed protein product [Brassica napus]VDD09008.1 unnamed protein product [Brassica oleracea]
MVFPLPQLVFIVLDLLINHTTFLTQSTVMAAVTSLLSDGIHIGVLVRGKKARDENKSTTLYHRVVVRVEKIQAT